MIHERIIALLDAAGVDYVLHEHVAVRTINEARAQVPALTVNLLKTIAFEISGGARVVLAAVAADSDVDYKALAAALGCNRRALRLMPPARVEAALGFEVGGIGPWPICPNLDIVIDSGLDDASVVTCGGGSRTLTFELVLAELVRASAARRGAITQMRAGVTE